ncbi:hypothetical protein B296_00010454 [Ensete ventricosum]|uniref:Uncharacterized protein n=1 Tax=Ensete ventricosum TaxID=4639 RepID=A0A426ZNY3_ENSVE|nr:hypothetical protein B296_00010454 [Ensete ventricosum]
MWSSYHHHRGREMITNFFCHCRTLIKLPPPMTSSSPAFAVAVAVAAAVILHRAIVRKLLRHIYPLLPHFPAFAVTAAAILHRAVVSSVTATLS